MMNLVEHLWQFQIPNIHIPPTVIKIADHPPKSYFYSLKQQSILRKKQHNVETSMTLLSPEEGEYFSMVEVVGQESRLSLVTPTEVGQILLATDTNASISKLDGKNLPLIFQCSYNPSAGTTQVKTIMVYRPQLFLWTTNLEKKDDVFTHVLSVKHYCQAMLASLKQKLPVKSSVSQIRMVLASDYKLSRIMLLWCSSLNFSHKEFYQIGYTFTATSKIEEQQDIKIQKHSTPHKQSKREFEESQAEDSITCKGCELQVSTQECKEAYNDEVLALRRRHGLSIFGILDEYLPVCPACFELMSQLNDL